MRGEIPRSPRTLRRKEEQLGPVVKPTRWDRTLKTGPFIVSLTGLFVSVVALVITVTVNGPSVLKNGEDFVKWYRTDQGLSGRWNNSGEGDIEPPTWSTNADDAVFLDIAVYQGQISGTAVSQRLCKYSLYTGVSVEGQISGNNGSIIFWDFIGGERQAFAKAKVHLDRANGVLDVNVIEQAPSLFPENFRLGKSTDDSLPKDDRIVPVDESSKAAVKEVEKMDLARYQGSFCKDALERAGQALKQTKK